MVMKRVYAMKASRKKSGPELSERKSHLSFFVPGFFQGVALRDQSGDL
jgi:hypothetical protein